MQDNVEQLDMEQKKVVLAGGREIRFSHCVIAVGSLGPAPARSNKVWFGNYIHSTYFQLSFSQLTIYELLKEYDEVGTAIEYAEKIVIVGGGAVGVEFAGENSDHETNFLIFKISQVKLLINTKEKKSQS